MKATKKISDNPYVRLKALLPGKLLIYDAAIEEIEKLREELKKCKEELKKYKGIKNES